MTYTIVLAAQLRCGQQCDEDGILSVVSRQACHEAADALEAKDAEIKRLREALGRLIDLDAEPNQRFLWGKKQEQAIAEAIAALTASYPEIKLEDVSDETLEQLHKSGQLPEGRYDEEKRRRSSK